jgi:hypothetical protein
MLRDSGCHVVSVLLISVAESDSANLVQAAMSLMNHKGDLPGFVVQNADAIDSRAYYRAGRISKDESAD